MDLQTLSQLFATTYNADPNIRKAAELEIRKVNVLSFTFIFISPWECRHQIGGDVVKIAKFTLVIIDRVKDKLTLAFIMIDRR
jgi:hypothetical protein